MKKLEPLPGRVDLNEMIDMKTGRPDIKKLYYDTIKFYQLPTYNHKVLQQKIKALEDEIGYHAAYGYLMALMNFDLRTMEGDFKPVLSNSLDIYGKRVKVLDFMGKHRNSVYVPPNNEDWAKLEELRKAHNEEIRG